MDIDDYDEDVTRLANDMFAILVGLCQEAQGPVLARPVLDNDGFELWRKIHQEFESHGPNEQLALLRTIMNPTFPKAEGEFSAAFHEWEGEWQKYQAETGKK